jgi:hypothetical protein
MVSGLLFDSRTLRTSSNSIQSSHFFIQPHFQFVKSKGDLHPPELLRRRKLEATRQEKHPRVYDSSVIVITKLTDSSILHDYDDDDADRHSE